MAKPAVHPVKWDPPQGAQTAPAANLPPLTVLQIGAHGPEDALVIGDWIYTGVADGRILRIGFDGQQMHTVADTGGRPLGLEAHPDGSVVVCDAVRGLLSLDPETGELTTLVAAGTQGLRVCNNAAVDADGTIFFSDSSQRFDFEHWTADLIEHSGTGRLLRRDPDGSVQVVVRGLQFANGVALTPEFVVVAQTGGYELTRVWLDSGVVEPLVSNLPAFPDNLSSDADGLTWVSMASARKSVLDGLPARVPILRKIIWALPEFLHPKPDHDVWVRAIDRDGRTVHEYFGGSEDFFMVTGVRVAGRRVVMGSLDTTALAWFDLPG